MKNVKACDWDFDEETFSGVSEEGKDFIRRLLVKIKEYVSKPKLKIVKRTHFNNSNIFLQKTYDSRRMLNAFMVEW